MFMIDECVYENILDRMYTKNWELCNKNLHKKESALLTKNANILRTFKTMYNIFIMHKEKQIRFSSQTKLFYIATQTLSLTLKDTYFPLVSTPSQIGNIVSIQMYSSVLFVYNVYNLYKKKVLKTLRAS